MAKVGDEVEQAITEVLKIFDIEELKKEQKDILNSLLARNNCMAILPTGYGKSLPYQMFPLVKRETAPGEAHQVIICSPLVALMEDQVSKLKKIPGVRAEYKGCSPQTDDNIRNGEVDFIFASPESLVGDAHWREELQKVSVGLIVVDEYHTIASWGEDEELEEAAAFRKWFRHVGELRTMFSDAIVLALSATCTNKVKKHVVKVMDLHQDGTKFFSISPNKSNIKLVVKKVDNTMESAKYWLIEALQSQKEHFPKCIVYANPISDVSKMYNYVCKELCCCQRLFDMYHSETTQEKKSSILEALDDSESTIRIHQHLEWELM